MHEELSDEPKFTTETGHPVVGTPHLENRREFLEHAMAGTAAALATSLPSNMAIAQDHHAQHEHHPDMGPLLAKELAHPFNQDPNKWLDAHEKEWQECFDCSSEPVTEVEMVCIDERMLMQATTQSGKRILRMAGSGVLWKNADELVNAIESYIKKLANGRPLNTITVKISAHLTCGAAGIAFGNEENPDKAASNYQEGTIVAKLRARGINAVHTGNAPMVKGPHTGIAAAVDCTDGRLQRLPGINSFVISSPNNVEQAIKEAMLALQIAAGSHAYGEALNQFTFVIFSDPARPEVAEQITKALQEQTKEYTAKGMDIRFVTRRAPAVK
ncbi:MAG: hypothetical protein PHO20_05840 [Candidatus Peribacteraceae bacterium]|nr:hypothetical protein [Candidatus Peribacteraceae bacterium]